LILGSKHYQLEINETSEFGKKVVIENYCDIKSFQDELEAVFLMNDSSRHGNLLGENDDRLKNIGELVRQQYKGKENSIFTFSSVKRLLLMFHEDERYTKELFCDIQGSENLDF